MKANVQPCALKPSSFGLGAMREKDPEKEKTNTIGSLYGNRNGKQKKIKKFFETGKKTRQN